MGQTNVHRDAKNENHTFNSKILNEFPDKFQITEEQLHNRCNFSKHIFKESKPFQTRKGKENNRVPMGMQDREEKVASQMRGYWQ